MVIDKSEAVVVEFTKAEKTAKLCGQMLDKMSDAEREVAAWLRETLDLTFFINSKEEVVWLQDVGGTFTIIGKTSRTKFVEDMVQFQSDFEESVKASSTGNQFHRYLLEVTSTNGVESVKFDCVLSDLRRDSKAKADKWAKLGLGDDFSIDNIRIVERLPF